MTPKACLALEIGPLQGPEVTAMLLSAGLASVRVEQDLSGNPRFVFAQAP